MALGTAAALVGSSIIGGIAQGSASKKAASAQRNAAADANEKLQPYVESGYGANNKLMELLGLSDGDVQGYLESLPGYKFTRDQGLKSVQSGYASRGLANSGAAMKGAASYATGLADSTYGNQFNRLLDVSKVGQNSAVGQGANTIGAGNATAAGYINQGNAITNAVSGVAGNYAASQMGLFNQPSSSWTDPDTGRVYKGGVS